MKEILKKQLNERKELVHQMMLNRAEFARAGNWTAVTKYTEIIAKENQIIAILEEEIG